LGDLDLSVRSGCQVSPEADGGRRGSTSCSYCSGQRFRYTGAKGASTEDADNTTATTASVPTHRAVVITARIAKTLVEIRRVLYLTFRRLLILCDQAGARACPARYVGEDEKSAARTCRAAGHRIPPLA